MDTLEAVIIDKFACVSMGIILVCIKINGYECLCHGFDVFLVKALCEVIFYTFCIIVLQAKEVRKRSTKANPGTVVLRVIVSHLSEIV